MVLSKELAASAITVILAVLAILIYIYYGAGYVFYTVTVAAVLIGLLNAWLISKSAEMAKGTGVMPRKRARKKRQRAA